MLKMYNKDFSQFIDNLIMNEYMAKYVDIDYKKVAKNKNLTWEELKTSALINIVSFIYYRLQLKQNK